MRIRFRGRDFVFRECDVQNYGEDEVLSAANEQGKVFYDTHNNNTYLHVPGIGYGIEDSYCIEEL